MGVDFLRNILRLLHTLFEYITDLYRHSVILHVILLALCLGGDRQLPLHQQPQFEPFIRNHFANFSSAARACNPFPHIQLQTTLQMYVNAKVTTASKSFVSIQLQVARALESSNPIKFKQIQDALCNTPGVGVPRGRNPRFLFHPYSQFVRCAFPLPWRRMVCPNRWKAKVEAKSPWHP